MTVLSHFFAVCQWKNFENPSRIDKVIDMRLYVYMLTFDQLGIYSRNGLSVQLRQVDINFEQAAEDN